MPKKIVKRPIVTPMPLTTLIRRRDSEVSRAKLRTFGAIIQKYEGFPPLRTPEGEMNYGVILDVFWMLAQEEDPEITFEEVEDGLTMEKIPEVMKLITEKFKISIPDEMAEQIAKETGITPEKPIDEGKTEEAEDTVKN